MDNLAHPVNVIKAYETLAGQLAHYRQWHSLIVVSFNNFQEVHTQNLKNHNEMFSIWTMMDEGIQKLSTVRTFRDYTVFSKTAHQMLISFVIISDRLTPFFCLPIFSNLIKNVYFIISCFNVVLSTLLNFQCNIAVVFEIFG